MKHSYILSVFTPRVYSETRSPQKYGFQYIVLRLWLTIDALTDADSVVWSTTVGVSKRSLCSFLPLAIFFTRNEEGRNGNVLS